MALEGTQSSPVVGPRSMALNLILALGLALGITAIFGRWPLWNLLLQGKPWQMQTSGGAAVALSFALPLVLLIKHIPRFDPFHRLLIDFLRRADLTGLNPLWFSLCAGVGEETLCRGALQPLLGLWLTSMLFTALHFQTGGFRTMNRLKAVYALLVFLASLLLGSVFVQLGLLAAIVTHSVVDIVALTMLRPSQEQSAKSV